MINHSFEYGLLLNEKTNNEILEDIIILLHYCYHTESYMSHRLRKQLLQYPDKIIISLA